MTALVLLYAVALIVPAGLVAATSSNTPVGGLSGRADSCASGINCLLDAPGGADVFKAVAAFLVLSLVIALPLRAYLVRAWKLPVLAAVVATFTAWFSTALLGCVGLTLLAR
jgi:hypothetical protein